MIVVSAEDVHRICAWEQLVEALRLAHRSPPPLVDRSTLQWERDGETQTYFNLPAALPGVAMGTKIVTVMPANPGRPRPLPAVQALYTLFDGTSGSPLAVLDATAMTYRKTAADSALGAKLLSRPSPGVMLMVGAGDLAPYLVAAHRAVRPSIARVLVWNRTPDKAEALAGALRRDGLGAAPAGDLEAAVREADLVSCATASTSPLVMGEWLKPGAHLDLVGGFTPEMRECDDEAVRRCRLFVDSRMFAVDQPGDLGDPIRRGVIGREKVEADLFDLCAEDYALERREEDVTLYKNGGGGHLDLYTALFVRERIESGVARRDADRKA